MPELTPAQAEAYARVRPGRNFLLCAELTHPALPSALRFVHARDSEEPVTLPPEVGEPAVTWQPLAFSFTRPSRTVKEGPGEGQIRLDGVSDKLRPHIKAMAATGEAATLNFYDYEVAVVAGELNLAAVIGPLQVVRGLLIRNISMDGLSASASIGHRDWGFVMFPRLIYDRVKYPALHG